MTNAATCCRCDAEIGGVAYVTSDLAGQVCPECFNGGSAPMTDPHETARKLVEAGILSLDIESRFRTENGEAYRVDDARMQWVRVDSGWLPDLDDPATCGVLMGMLMERCRGHITVDAYGASFEVYDRREPDGKVWGADVLGEALALTLLEMKETTDE